MQDLIAFIKENSDYFSFLTVALFSFFVSLPKDLHPLTAIELIFKQIGKKVNLDNRSDSYKRLASLLSLAIIYLPCILIISQLYNIVYQPFIVDICLLFILLSWHDKKIVYLDIINALKPNNYAQAKYKLASLTCRETKPLSLMGINKATIESMVLQLCASWFAVVFWYLLTGIYGAIFYRCLQICAQQWNSKQAEFNAISTIPSFLYSLLLLPVHLLVSFTFALYDKPLLIGVNACQFCIKPTNGTRQQQKVTYATLGCGNAPERDKIKQSLQRLSLSAWFWLFCITAYTFFPLLLEFISSNTQY